MCHHLGHFYFAQLFKSIIQLHGNTALLICPSDNYYANTPAFKRMVFEVCGNWLSCFEFHPHWHQVHYLIYSQPIDGSFAILRQWIEEREQACQRLGVQYGQVVDAWRRGGIPDKDRTEELRSLLDLDVDEVDATQVLALAYVLIKRPRWYSPHWFVQSIRSFLRGPDSVAKRLLNTDDILILEAAKNRTSWESLAACSNRFSLGKFAPRAYVVDLPSAVGESPMKSSADGAIFLYDDPDELLARYDISRIADIVERFGEALPMTVEKRFAALLTEGAKVLRQRRLE
jgi:hypothetical protein